MYDQTYFDDAEYQPTMNYQYQLPRKKRHRHRHRKPRQYYNTSPDDQPDHTPAPTPAPTYYKEPTICYRCGMEGHIAVGCRVRLDHSRAAYQYQQINAEDSTYQHSHQQSRRDTAGLTGTNSEVTVKINNISALALLDTGSTVSTVSETFYQQYLSDEPIQQLDKILHIECADGENLPYLGYVAADLELPGTSTTVQPQRCLLLVVPDSTYNRQIPLLLGTNVLTAAMKDVKQRFGPRFLQDAELHTPWYLTFRCLLLRERELNKRCNRLGIIKCAEGKTIRIQPNRDVVLQGYIDHELPYHPVCGLLQPTDRAAIPTDLDIAPSLISYQYHNNGIIPVHISNVTTRTVTVSPNAILCELQPVTVADIDTTATTENDAWYEATFPNDTLTEDQLKKAKELLHQFRDVFSTSDTDIGHTTAGKHRIDLAD